MGNLSLLPGQLLHFIQGLFNTKFNINILKSGRELQLHLQSCDLVSLLGDGSRASGSAN